MSNFVPEVWGAQLMAALGAPSVLFPEPDEATRARWKARREAKAARLARFRADLDAITDMSSRTILDLHRPSGPADNVYPDCEGCDFGGYEGEAPGWPCRTVDAIAESHGIEAFS